MAGLLHGILERFQLSSRLFCITTDNALNNNTLRKELKDLLIQDSGWNSKATKIPCMAHVIQLVVKAILKSFNVKLGPKLIIKKTVLEVDACQDEEEEEDDEVEEDYEDYENDEDDEEEEEEEEEEEDDEDGVLPNPYVSKSVTIIIDKVSGIRVTVYNNDTNYKMSRFAN